MSALCARCGRLAAYVAAQAALWPRLAVGGSCVARCLAAPSPLVATCRSYACLRACSARPACCCACTCLSARAGHEAPPPSCLGGRAGRLWASLVASPREQSKPRLPPFSCCSTGGVHGPVPRPCGLYLTGTDDLCSCSVLCASGGLLVSAPVRSRVRPPASCVRVWWLCSARIRLRVRRAGDRPVR